MLLSHDRTDAVRRHDFSRTRQRIFEQGALAEERAELFWNRNTVGARSEVSKAATLACCQNHCPRAGLPACHAIDRRRQKSHEARSIRYETVPCGRGVSVERTSGTSSSCRSLPPAALQRATSRAAGSSFRSNVGAVRRILETRAIDDQNSAALRSDQTVHLETLEGNGHPRSAHTQHARQELMGKRQVVAVDAVVRHQQPAGQTLFDFVTAIGHGSLGRLDDECIADSEQPLLERGALRHRATKQQNGDPMSVPCYLYVSLMRRAIAAHDH